MNAFPYVFFVKAAANAIRDPSLHQAQRGNSWEETPGVAVFQFLMKFPHFLEGKVPDFCQFLSPLVWMIFSFFGCFFHEFRMG